MVYMKGVSQCERLTYLAHNLVVLQDTPGDINTVILPVRLWHMLIYISIYPSHDFLGLAATRRGRCWPERPELGVANCMRIHRISCLLRVSQMLLWKLIYC